MKLDPKKLGHGPLAEHAAKDRSTPDLDMTDDDAPSGAAVVYPLLIGALLVVCIAVWAVVS